jgi:tetratricopeptide (TPR) repeat protein
VNAAGRWWAFPAVLTAAVFILYGRTVTYDFVNYDDYDLVVMNTEFLSDPSSILAAFRTHAFTSHREESVYYRPVLLLSYMADYAVWKSNPAGYHLTNVLLHAAAVLTLYFLVLALLRGDGGGRQKVTALFAALLFAAHPVQTESVAWVSGRNDVLLGLLLLLSFLCYVEQYREWKRRSWMFPLSALLFGAALLTKESAIFFLPLYPLYDLAVRREPVEQAFAGRNHLRISTFLAIAAAYLVLRYNIFGTFIGAEKLYGKIPLDNRFLMAPGLAFTNLLFLLWPSKLSIIHPLENVTWLEWPASLVAIAACAALVAAGWSAFRRAPAIGWAVAWLAAGIVPLVNIFPLAVPILEHRLYAASAGFAVAAAAVVMRLFGTASGGRATGTQAAQTGRAGIVPVSMAAPAIPLLLTACVVLAALTWVRLPAWANSEALWLDAIAKEPGGARAYFNLAGYYFERRQFDRTAVLLEKYVALKPDDFTGFTKLRQTYFLAGRPMDAARVCRAMIERDPTNPGRYVEAGILFEKLGIGDSVVSVYEEGLRVNPDFYQLHKRLGIWYRSTGNPVKAAWHLGVADSLVRVLQSPPGTGREQ